jgi:hypothetical protein
LPIGQSGLSGMTYDVPRGHVQLSRRAWLMAAFWWHALGPRPYSVSKTPLVPPPP